MNNSFYYSRYKSIHILTYEANTLSAWSTKSTAVQLYAILFKENPQYPIVYHEYIHYLLAKHPVNIPAWFNEG